MIREGKETSLPDKGRLAGASPRRGSPQFKIGDRVCRRPGTLGNMDGRGPVGTVEAIGKRGVHTVLTVAFLSHTETFTADTYQPAYK